MASEYEEVIVEPGQAILSDLQPDSVEESVYALTEHRVSKFFQFIILSGLLGPLSRWTSF